MKRAAATSRPRTRRAPTAAPSERGGQPWRRELLAAARAVRLHAHAPYSRFQVGAAVMDDAGRIHAGCNVENASYGLTICAERNAVAAAVAAGAKALRAVAIVTRMRPPATPCGACRQVLAEFGGDDTVLLLAGPSGAAREQRLGALLPEAFRLR
jgi:cytidine deaminase